jgi:hypothetical protein
MEFTWYDLAIATIQQLQKHDMKTGNGISVQLSLQGKDGARILGECLEKANKSLIWQSKEEIPDAHKQRH